MKSLGELKGTAARRSKDESPNHDTNFKDQKFTLKGKLDKDDVKDERTTKGKTALDYFHEKSYQALVEKSNIYNKMKSGDYKEEEEEDGHYVGHDSTEKDEKGNKFSVLPKRPTADDVLFEIGDGSEATVEVEDEFGRSRTVPKSEAYLYRKYPNKFSDHFIDEIVVNNDSTYEPEVEGPVARPKRVIRGSYVQTETFKVDVKRAQEIRDFAENDDSAASHYDPSWEVRTKGTGFYNFETMDEKLRHQQMKSLNNSRHETEQYIEASSTYFPPSHGGSIKQEESEKESVVDINEEDQDPLLNPQSECYTGASQSHQRQSEIQMSQAENFINSCLPNESKVEYLRRVNQRKKVIESLRNKRMKHMKTFVKGSEIL